jgi:2-hydroxychromene-2-carboxylate isomerase
MKQITFWFDPVSPYAYLAFERLPQALEGISCLVTYRPILFAGLLKQWGQKGPAEIEPKRAWTFRQVHWLAHSLGLPMQTPVRHPFNPLAHLRLLLASAHDTGTPNRRACELVLRHIWRGGEDANDAARLADLAQRIAPTVTPDDPGVKQALRDSTDAAIAKGVFGVPTMEVDGRMFWGVDALPMLSAYLAHDPWFDGPTWQAEAEPRDGVHR